LYNKLQEGVITTINNALEDKGHQNSRQQMINQGYWDNNMKRSQSSQQPQIRNGNYNLQNQLSNPRIISGQKNHRQQDLDMQLNFDNCTNTNLRNGRDERSPRSAAAPQHANMLRFANLAQNPSGQ